MSLAIRKRSWEEHVTQWMGLPFGSIDSNILCSHGLVADSLQASMENDGVRSGGQKETHASLPDCCHSGEVLDFPLKLLGSVFKGVDENDNHQEKEEFFSLEASTETLVNISVESDNDDNGEVELSLEKANYHVAQGGEKLSHESNHMGRAEPLMKTEPRVEAEKESTHACAPAGKVNGPQYDAVPKLVKVEDHLCDSREESLELYCDNSSSENGRKENLCLSQEKNVSEKKLVHTAIGVQQYRKLETPTDGCEKTVCSPTNNKLFPGQCHDKYSQADLAAASNDQFFPLPDSHLLSGDNELEGFAVSQNKLITSEPWVEGGTCLKNSVAMREATDSQVTLRKRKEAREGRDQSRLDSMVLLILKLDQLDQDIENALSSGSSPSSTPTHSRRQIHDFESHLERGVDVATVSQPQTNMPPPPHSYGADHILPIPMAGSGAIPKAGPHRHQGLFWGQNGKGRTMYTFLNSLEEEKDTNVPVLGRGKSTPGPNPDGGKKASV